MKLRTASLALMISAGLALVGCSGDRDTAAPESSAPPSKPGSDATGTLRVWLMEGQPQSVIDAANDSFKKSYPNVTVDVQLQKWTGIQEKLDATLGTPETPDVVEVGNAMTARIAAEGLLSNLSASALKLGVDSMIPGLVVAGEYQGVRYGIPYYGGVQVLVYNKAQFKDAGIKKVPETYNQLLAAAKKLQAAKGEEADYSAFYFPGKYWYGALPFVWMNGGDIATLDGQTWTGALDSPSSQQGLTQLEDLVLTYSRAPKDGDGSKNVEAFRAGKVGMMIDWWWVPGTVDSGKLKGDVGALVLPGLTGPAPTFIQGSDLAVSAKSSEPGLALEYISVLSGLPVQTKLAKEGGVIPNQKGAFVGHKGNEFLQVADRAAETARFTPVSPNWGSVESEGVIPDMLYRILTGQATVPDASAVASQSIGEILNG
jgi:N,N'-diacetylchitobiose transport system substrate-binding protein